ncbi:hypothetical protein [Burkholderia sp. Ax-1719]|uniref:hypothetical protein n=1 Tax=Burkholderia sp. Ax-1719 TaxID=2608334 RepID=UPI001423FB7E|nr:hypothetical protein [Burkholderia sp. Ax-1719]
MLRLKNSFAGEARVASGISGRCVDVSRYRRKMVALDDVSLIAELREIVADLPMYG